MGPVVDTLNLTLASPFSPYLSIGSTSRAQHRAVDAIPCFLVKIPTRKSMLRMYGSGNP